jgi:catechol 2,3-dioxygenase-like lactoylglutathione lyase family enzyme
VNANSDGGKKVGVHSLDHFALEIPALDEGALFYERFGLTVSRGADEFGISASESSHRWGRFLAGRKKTLRYLSFGAYSEDMPIITERIKRRGITFLAPDSNAIDDSGIWFRDDDNTLIEIRVAEKVSPNAKSIVSNPTAPGGVAAMPLRSDAPFVRPRRLSHVLVFTSDVERAIKFYQDTVGLGLSDAAGDGIAFMHGIHGSDHHLVAFAKSDAGGFHHCSWDVESVNDVGLGAMQMASHGHVAGWGLGRHVLGSNYFHYVRDPWGSYCEYSNDIDYVPAGGAWKSSHVSPDNGFYLWGPNPPADFAVNYESPSALLPRELAAERQS